MNRLLLVPVALRLKTNAGKAPRFVRRSRGERVRPGKDGLPRHCGAIGDLKYSHLRINCAIMQTKCWYMCQVADWVDSQVATYVLLSTTWL